MISKIEGKIIPPQQITYREIGFGRAVADLPLYSYELDYEKNEFVALIGKEYEEFLLDQKADDEVATDPYPKYLKELGYPLLVELMKREEYFEDTMKSFFRQDIFAASFPSEDESLLKWVINTIDQILVNKQQVIIKGKAFEK